MNHNETSVELKQHSENSGLAERSPGIMLQQARNAAGLTQAEVARSLCLAINVIAALERDDYSSLPGMSYTRGYIRAYANLLNQSPDLVMASFDRQVGNDPLMPAIKTPLYISQKENIEKEGFARGTTYLLILGLIVLVFLWWHEHRARGQKEIATAISQNAIVANAADLSKRKIQMPDPTVHGPGFGTVTTNAANAENSNSWMPQDPVVILKQPGSSDVSTQ